MALKITKSFSLSLDRERQTGQQRRRRRKDSKEERGIGENFVPVPGAVGRGARAAEKSLERRTETGKTGSRCRTITLPSGRFYPRF